MAGLSSTLTLRLIDAVSGPAKGVKRSLDGLDRRMKKTARDGGGIGMVGAFGAQAAALAGLAIGARGAVEGVTRFATAERRLTRVAATANASLAQKQAAFKAVHKIAEQTAQPVDNVVGGLESLVAQGKDLDSAMAFLPAVARTAQASGADVTDIANSAGAVADNFKIAETNIQGAFDALVTGGKIGKFELPDMARYLPSLAPQAAAAGFKGQQGLNTMIAMLQVIREQSGTSEEAATRMGEVFGKMMTEETTKKFKKVLGIDLQKHMKKAIKNGDNLVEVFTELTKTAIKGDFTKLPLLFGDKEMRLGMMALVSGFDKIKQNVDEINRTAAGSTMRDLGEVMKDTQADIDKLAGSWDRLLKSFGRGLVDMGVADQLDEISKQSNTFFDALEKRQGGLLEKFGKILPHILPNPGKLMKDLGKAGEETGLDKVLLGEITEGTTWKDRLEGEARLPDLTEANEEIRKLREKRRTDLREAPEHRKVIENLLENARSKVGEDHPSVQRIKQGLLDFDKQVEHRRASIYREELSRLAKGADARLMGVTIPQAPGGRGRKKAATPAMMPGTSFIPQTELPTITPQIDLGPVKAGFVGMQAEARTVAADVQAALSGIDTFSAGARAGAQFAAGLRSQVGAVQAAAGALASAANVSGGGGVGAVARGLDRSRQASMTDRPVTP